MAGDPKAVEQRGKLARARSWVRFTGGTAGTEHGRVERIARSGDLQGTEGDKITASSSDPACLVRVWRRDAGGDWSETDIAVAMRARSLTVTDPLEQPAKQTTTKEAAVGRTAAHAPRGGQLALEHKDAGGAIAEAESTDDPVTVILSVTGIVDDVDDLIEPGAYAKTLADRTPKIVNDHDWTKKAGKCTQIAEYLPGDSNLPKTLPNGDPWPEKAGAVIADVQWLSTPEGTKAKEEVAFYGSDKKAGAQFSIGYNVPPGKSYKDQAGVRHIKELDLYEGSPVLWGANRHTGLVPQQKALPMSGGGEGDGEEMIPELELKTLPVEIAGKAGPAAPEAAPAAGAAGEGEGEGAAEGAAAAGEGEDEGEGAAEGDEGPQVGTGIGGDPATWPGTHAYVWDGTVVTDDDGETMCRCGKGEDDDAHGIDLTDTLDHEELEALFEALSTDVYAEVDRYLELATKRHELALELKAGQTCKFGGEPATQRVSGGKADMFVCDKHVKIAEAAVRKAGGNPTASPIGDPKAGESKVAGQEASPKDVQATERLRAYWVHGAGAAKIRWGEPNDFYRCVKELGKYLGDRAKGYCQLRHKEALGVYAGQEDPKHGKGSSKKEGGPVVEVKVAGGSTTEAVKALGAAVEAMQAEDGLIEVAGRKFVEYIDEPGGAEPETKRYGVRFPGSWEADQEELAHSLREAVLPADNSTRKYGGDGPSPVWLSIQATYDDRIYYSIYGGDIDTEDATDFCVTYTLDDTGEPTFGTPEAQDFITVPVPAGSSSGSSSTAGASTGDTTPGLAYKTEDDLISHKAADDLDGAPECCGRPAESKVHDAVETKAAAGKKPRAGAMADDSYPITDAASLKDAVAAFGRGLGDTPADQTRKAAIKRHIIARAKALKLTANLPADWKSTKQIAGLVLEEKRLRYEALGVDRDLWPAELRELDAAGV